MRIILFTVFLSFALIFSGCSKQDADSQVDSDTAPAETEAVEDAVAETIEAAEDVQDEVLQVVEESAAESDEDVSEAIVLAQAPEAAAARTWQFSEGKNFRRLVPTQPTVGSADKIEVAEIFMYSCPHCMDLEPHINRWAENRDPNIRFVRIPAIFNGPAKMHAQLYYTEEVLARNGLLKEPEVFRATVFDEFHRRGNRLVSESSIQKLFARAGVSEDDFTRAWTSFEVNKNLTRAGDLARRYGVDSVPMVVVNGKYTTTAAAAGSYPKLMELIDELTEREGLR